MKKTVLITGASGNLGKATVEKFISAGYKVIAMVSPGKALPVDPAADLETVEADLRNEGQVNEVINQIITNHKIIDGALLLAGGFAAGGIKAADGEGIKNMYELNFETAYFVARPVFLQMQKQPSGGRIVFVGGPAAWGLHRAGIGAGVGTSAAGEDCIEIRPSDAQPPVESRVDSAAGDRRSQFRTQRLDRRCQ